MEIDVFGDASLPRPHPIVAFLLKKRHKRRRIHFGGITMIQLTIAEARSRLPELLSAAEAGQLVTIRGANGQTFRAYAAAGRACH